jgi:hypothetical protein
MKLIHLLDQIETFNVEYAIYTASDREVNENSNVMAIKSHYIRGSRIPEGMKYLIDVELAKEILNVWSNWRQGRKPSLDEKYKAIQYYLENDAYIPNEK